MAPQLVLIQKVLIHYWFQLVLTKMTDFFIFIWYHMCTQKKIKRAFSMKMVLEQTATAIKLIAAVFCAKIFIYKAYLGASGQNLKK